MKKLAWMLLSLPLAVQAQETHEMHEAREHMRQHHGDSINYLLIAERFEQRYDDGDAALDWEAQGWIGKDLDRLWLKTEGEGYADTDAEQGGEVQLLYGRALAPFWDLQAGLRRDFGDEGSRTHLVFGIQGLAPYWFETDLAAFVSEEGELAARLEVEYELLFTQRLVLQPRLELNYHFDAVPELGIGRGLSELDLSLRLRYEIRREFAPYVGLGWSRSYGGSADLLRAGGQALEEGSVVAGVRFWY